MSEIGNIKSQLESTIRAGQELYISRKNYTGEEEPPLWPRSQQL